MFFLLELKLSLAKGTIANITISKNKKSLPSYRKASHWLMPNTFGGNLYPQFLKDNTTSLL